MPRGFGCCGSPLGARVPPPLGRLGAHRGDRLRFVGRDLPLPRHAHALMAAEAAREVLAQHGSEAFWQMHNLLFAAQSSEDGLSPAIIERIAVEAGADRARLRLALEDHRHRAVIDADIAAASATGLRMGTPAFFVNGHFMSGARPLGEFRQRIDALLEAR